MNCKTHKDTEKKLLGRGKREQEGEKRTEGTYGGLVVHGKDVVDITLDDGCLSGADIANDENLIEVLSNLGRVRAIVHYAFYVCPGGCSDEREKASE